MRFTIATSFSKPEHLAELAVAADESGFDMLAFSDHVVHPEKIDTPYPYTEDGEAALGGLHGLARSVGDDRAPRRDHEADPLYDERLRARDA